MSTAPENINWEEVIKFWVNKVTSEEREVVIDPLNGFKGWRELQRRIKEG